MKLLRLTALATMLGLSSAVCATASTDSNYVCMISGAGINVHWKTDTAGNYYEMMVDAPKPGATGYAAVGWNPTNPTGNKMFGATVMMGSTADLNTVKRYLPTNTNAANIIATETAIPSTITQTAITSTSTRLTVKFRRTGVSTGNLLTIFAFGATGALSNHGTGGRGTATISLADGIPIPACTASTDSNFVCMITGAGMNVHWKTDTAGNYYEMMVDAPKPGATGYAAVGWNPTNPTGNKMFGATVMMGSTADLNTVKRYLPTNTNAANIIATETAIPSTITQTAITSTSTRLTVKFRRTGVSTGSLLTIFAFGATGALSNHGTGGRAAATINLASVPATPAPTTAPVCTASTLVHTGTTNYQCMKALTNGVVIHWNMATTGTTAIAATSTNVNGWFAVAFPTNAGAMAPATSVAMSSATAAGIYAITAKSAAGIATTTSTVVDTPTVETANGLRILRYNAAVSILTANMAVNYAFHSSEIGFPVNIHSTRGAGTVDFVNPVATPAPAATPAPPATPTSCTASTLIQTGTTTYDCMLALSAAVTIHWNRETTATNTAMAASAGVGGWLSIGFPTVATSMTPATAVSSNAATTAGIFAITGRSAAGIAATTSPNLNTATTELVNGQRIIRFNVLTSFLADNMPVNYAVHTSNVQFPIASAQHTSRGSSAVNFAAGTAQSVVGARDFEEARTHGGAMIAIWAYWVPLAILIKGAGPLVCKGKVCEFPIPFVIHIAMMFIAMSLTTVFAAIALSEFDNDVEYGHREIGIVILSIGWVQVLGGIAKPANDSSFRKYWGWGHLLFGFSIFILAVVQMAYGYKNLETLYANEDIDPMKHALIAGLVAFGTIYIGCRIYMIVTKEEQPEQEDDKESESSSSNEPDKEN